FRLIHGHQSASLLSTAPSIERARRKSAPNRRGSDTPGGTTHHHAKRIAPLAKAWLSMSPQLIAVGSERPMKLNVASVSMAHAAPNTPYKSAMPATPGMM